MTVRNTGRKEEGSIYYDKIYRQCVLDNGGYNTERYNAVYDVILDRLLSFPYLAKGDIRILEIGCGTGALAERFLDAGYGYAGFDFSREARESQSARVRKHTWVGDAYSRHTWFATAYNTVVACEVFEHVDDHRVLRRIPEETRILFSVPNFDSRSHLRRYCSEEGIRRYYKGLIDLTSLERVNMKCGYFITVCDGTKI